MHDFALFSNIEYVRLRKPILDSAYAESHIAFPNAVYSLLDSKASNIYIYIYNI